MRFKLGQFAVDDFGRQNFGAFLCLTIEVEVILHTLLIVWVKKKVSTKSDDKKASLFFISYRRSRKSEKAI